jgi:hypothetical protein
MARLLGTSSSHGMSARLKPVVTGGTLTSDATYYYRTFTASGTLSVTGSLLTADVLLVAGGGGGGASAAYIEEGTIVRSVGGGGGAGGLLYNASQGLTASTYTVTIGAGGSSNSNGNESLLTGYTAKRGCLGGGNISAGNQSNYGSGGGGFAERIASVLYSYDAGTSPAAGQGNSGGAAAKNSISDLRGGGGGGAGSAGSAAGASAVGNGGTGTAYFGTTYASGGGGGGLASGQQGTASAGGGGNGSGTGTGSNGTTNRGGGGGGAGGETNSSGGNGGSGIVIVRYTKSQVD